MTNHSNLHDRINRIFQQKLNLDVPSTDTDLVETGMLDSLGFVDLLVYLEQEFGSEILTHDIEIDNFRSVASIATFVASQGSATATA